MDCGMNLVLFLGVRMIPATVFPEKLSGIFGGHFPRYSPFGKKK
jgi:hypothetical protein